MNVVTPVPEPRTADPADPLKPVTVTGTSWPWMLLPDAPGTPVRGRRKRKRQARDYETRCVEGHWHAICLRGGPPLDAATEAELRALILADMRASR